MAGTHLRLQEYGAVSGRSGSKFCRPLRRLPVLHSRVVQPCGDQHGRIVDVGEVLVRRVRSQPPVLLFDIRIPPLLPFDDRERERLVQHRVHDIDERDLSDDRPEAPGVQVDGCADRESPCARAAYGDLAGISVARVGQVSGRVDQVGERVHLVGQLALLVPGLPHFPATAHVSDRVNDATIEQAQSGYREPCRHRDLVRSICVDDERCSTIKGCVCSIHDRDRDEGAVSCSSPLTPGRVLARNEVAEDLLLLEECSVSRHDVVIEHRRWCHRGLEAVTQQVRLELVVGARSEFVDRLIQSQVRRRPVDRVHDQSGRQTIVTPPHDHVVGEAIGILEFRPRVVCNHLNGGATGDGHAKEPTVERPVVRDDPELVAAMVNGVLNTLDARLDDGGFSLRVVCRHTANVTRDGGPCHDEDEIPTARPLDAHVVALVVLLEHEDVARCFGPEPMPPDLPWTHRGIGHRVEVVS